MKQGQAMTWSIGEELAMPISRLLHSLLHESRARCALLIERSGHLIARAGARPDFDADAFAALAAADFSANQELASQIGEAPCDLVVHQGRGESAMLGEVADHLLLLVLFEDRIPLGRIRIKVRQVIHGLSELLGPAARGAEATSSPGTLGARWSDAAGHAIDRLFGAP